MLSAPGTLRLRTAENVGIDYRLAGLGSRFLARALDELLLAVIETLVVIGGFALLSGLASSENGQAMAGLLLGALVIFVRVLYFVLLEWAMSGQTPGKRRLGIRVVRASGGGIGFTESLIRNLVRAFEELLVFTPTVIAMFIDRRFRRPGDFAAGTLVVHERRPPAGSGAPGALSAPPAHLHIAEGGEDIAGLAALGQREHSFLRSFLSRSDLDPALRRRLSAEMGVKLCDRMGLAPDSPERLLEPELLIERLYLQLSRRLGARP